MNDQIKKCLQIANCFEFMPDSDGKNKQSELSNLFLKHPISDSVTFFGGSFNPFHQGHRACLDLCPEKNILIVLDRNPFKEVSQNQKLFDDFVSLAEKLKETHYSLYPGFLAKAEANPTANWLPKVKIYEKNFLMGDDSFMSLLKWKNPEVLIKALSKIYVVPREFSNNDYLKIERELKKINPALEIIYLGTHPYQHVSSSELRKTKI